MRLLTDQDVYELTIRQLRTNGNDVVTAHDLGLSRAPDDELLRVARFKTRNHRRAEWTRDVPPTRAMWEHVLDALKRKYTRRDEAELHDIADVEIIVGKLPAE